MNIMNLTYNDFSRGEKLFQGRLLLRFNFMGSEIFKLQPNDFFIRIDSHLLPIVGFSPEIELYRIQGRLVLIFLTNHCYTFVESVKVVESQIVNQFNGFELGKEYELKNGQIWQQISNLSAQTYISSGYVKIINDEIMKVDDGNFFPKVKLINNVSSSFKKRTM